MSDRKKEREEILRLGRLPKGTPEKESLRSRLPKPVPPKRQQRSSSTEAGIHDMELPTYNDMNYTLRRFM